MAQLAFCISFGDLFTKSNLTMKNSLLACAMLVLSLAAACSADSNPNSSATEQTETATNIDPATNQAADADAPKSIQDAMNQAQEALNQLNNANKVEVVNFRKLKELLPEKLNGYERKSSKGETSGAMGMNISTAEAQYEKNGQTVNLTLLDTGGLGLATMGLAAWTTLNVDKEDEFGYERTGDLDGYKSYEKFRKKGGTSEISVVVNNRFIVRAEAQITDENQMNDLRAFIKEIGLNNLSNLN